MDNENPGKKAVRGVWIRKKLWDRRDITWFEKCLICEIGSFDICFASNKYLANFMGTSEQVIQNSISKFRGLGLVLDWGEHGNRQLTIADCVSADPENPPTPVPKQLQVTKPRGLLPLNPEVYIDTRGANRESTKRKAEVIYKEYPKKVARPEALRAISRQLRDYDFDTLLSATIAYAKARKGEEQRFTPNPATWFNQQRFNDDFSTWVAPKSSGNGAAPPKYIPLPDNRPGTHEETMAALKAMRPKTEE